METIVALSTPEARSAIAVVRLSGDGAIAVADRVFRARNGKPLSSHAGYTAALGDVISQGEILDEAVALVMREPKSYTGEDVVEISCHGNPDVAAALVTACISAGARSAGHGEFTRRAFENGKLDLTQAEAVAELIEAEGDAARRAALRRRNGALGKRADEICEALALTAAQLAVWSDYPEEEDAPAITAETMREEIAQQIKALEALAAGHRTGRMVQNGISVAIIGRPNVGKSTLLNRLTGQERAIVTDVAGTTRDVLEAPAEVGGVRLRLLDTAGIRESEDIVERMGVERARKALTEADLVLLVLDGSSPLSEEDRMLLAAAADRPTVAVVNKSDLPRERQEIPDLPRVSVSARTGEGFEELEKEIVRILGLSATQDADLIAGERQYDCVLRAIAALRETDEALAAGVTLDAAGILLDEALSALGELTGRTASALTLEQVFSRFCVGK